MDGKMNVILLISSSICMREKKGDFKYLVDQKKENKKVRNDKYPSLFNI